MRPAPQPICFMRPMFGSKRLLLLMHPRAIEAIRGAGPRGSSAAVEPLENRIAPAYLFSVSGTTATATGGTSTDHLVIDVVGGLLEHSVNGGAFSTDWDSAAPGVQTLAANAASTVSIHVGSGDGSTLLLGTSASPASQLVAHFLVVAPANTLDAVTIDDSAGTALNTYRVDTGPGTITGAGINYDESGGVFFGGGVTIKGSALNGDVFNIVSIGGPFAGRAEPFTVIAGSAGTSVVDVGSGVLTVGSPLAVYTAGGMATLNLHDQSDTTHAAATFDKLGVNVNAPFEITGLSFAAIQYGAGVSAVNVTGGRSGAIGVTYNVESTQAGTTATITGGANQNFYNLSNAAEAGGLGNLSGPVVVHGGTSLTDVVTLDDSSANSNDAYTVTSTAVSRTAFGGLTYDDNIRTLTLNAENALGMNGNSTISIKGTADSVITNINGQGGGDTIQVNQTGFFGSLNVTTGNGGSTVSVLADNEPVTIHDGAADTINIGSSGGPGTLDGILSPITITNSAAAQNHLAIHDENSAVGKTWSLNVDNGGDTGSIAVTNVGLLSFRPGDLADLTMNGGAGVNVFNVNASVTGVLTTIVGGAAQNTVNFGTGGSLAAITGPVAVTSSAPNTALILDDHNDTTHGAATLDRLSSDLNAPYEVTGLSGGAIEYGFGVTDVNISGGANGAAGVTFNVNATQGDSTVTLTGGPNQNFLNLSNASQSGGLENLAGAVVVHGGTSRTDVVTLEDSAADFNDTYTVTGTTVGRVVFGGLTYDANIGTLTLNAENNLGTNGSNTIDINSTADFVITNVNSQGGDDTININQTGFFGALNVTTGSGGATVNVLADHEPVTIHNNGSDTVNIGSSGGAGTLDNISSPISLTNVPSFTHLTIHDENSTIGKTWTLSVHNAGNAGSVAATGVGLISFRPGDLFDLSIYGGGGANVFNVDGTPSGAQTTITGGAASDVFNLSHSGQLNGLNNLPGPVVVHGNGGSDSIRIFDQDAVASDTYTITDASVTRTGGFGGLTYDGTFSTLSVTDANGSHSFDVSGWNGTGSLTNTGGTTDTVTSSKSASYTLADALLTATGGLSVALSGISMANLTDTGGGHSFDVSGWNGTGSLANTGGTTDTVTASKGADFTLGNAALAAGTMNLSLSGIGMANLTDAGGGHSFTVSNWTGTWDPLESTCRHASLSIL